LTKDVKEDDIPVGNVIYVIDGGALLHLVKWLPNGTYEDIIKQYKDFLVKAFGQCTVVFDGYYNGPRTIDHKHQVQGSRLSQRVTVTLNKKVEVSQDIFLKNGKNKTMLILFLGDHLREYGFKIFKSDGDADTLIVKVAIQQANSESSVVVHAVDVDIFCMVMHHYDESMGDVYFQTVKKKNGNRQPGTSNM
jgi:hypothetical protein